MPAKEFDSTEWEEIMKTLDKDPKKYGLPKRIYGSAVLGSFNIRKLGSVEKRSEETWNFLVHIIKRFDLIAIQEIQDNLDGFNKIMEMLGTKFGMIVSDRTGVFPGQDGMGERLGFIYRRSMVKRTDVVSDITYDRSKLLETLYNDLGEIKAAIKEYKVKLAEFEDGTRKTKPYISMPVFLSFIRQPYCASFEITGHEDTALYKFMAVNAHLYYGNTLQDRKLEFNALIEWIIGRVKENRAYYPNFILLGDLNLNFDNPDNDRPEIEKKIKKLNKKKGNKINVYFPFFDKHPKSGEYKRTNARITETFDQIGLFSHEGLPTAKNKKKMGKKKRGPNYEVFNFVELFSQALLKKSFKDMEKDEKTDFIKRFEHEVSDHMPIWLRIPLPDE